MSRLRFDIVRESFKKKPVAVEIPDKLPSEYFAEKSLH